MLLQSFCKLYFCIIKSIFCHFTWLSAITGNKWIDSGETFVRFSFHNKYYISFVYVQFDTVRMKLLRKTRNSFIAPKRTRFKSQVRRINLAWIFEFYVEFKYDLWCMAFHSLSSIGKPSVITEYTQCIKSTIFKEDSV